MVHTSTEDEDSREDDQNHGFQERLIMSVALLTAVSLISATVMALVQLLQLEEYKPEAEGGTNETTDVSDWTLVAGFDPAGEQSSAITTVVGRSPTPIRTGHCTRDRPLSWLIDVIMLDCSKKLEIVSTILRWKSFPVRVTRVLRDGSKVVIETTHLLRQGRTYNLTVQFQGRLRKDYGLVLKRVGDQVILFMFPRKLDAFVTFPCFKDPGWKTTFDVRLLVDENLHASSTASIENTMKESNGSTVYVFHRTEPMSAYLLSAIFTNFSVDRSGRMNLWSSTSEDRKPHGLPSRSEKRGGGERIKQQLLFSNSLLCALELSEKACIDHLGRGGSRELYLTSCTSMREAITPEKRVGIALYKLCSSAEDRNVANLFGVGRLTVNILYRQFCGPVVAVLEHEWIKMVTAEDMARHIQEFEAVTGFRQGAGALDGFHFLISPPKEHATDYYNYKGW
ncbi:hypothetical protein HPB51_028693 [Rhipicephalus microplus]|uniref:Aminopeptidase N-like N-terminal domain-containing protein n=1 Tax=Rhipicephalus microplus TaxID=6941 RepID=A0A9J6CWK9_RHIMP|nr:hypothetical protein HPB51_028693 [Rhipicephalus microplus]